MHRVGKCTNRFPSEHAGARTYTLLPTLTVSTACPVHNPPDAHTILFIKITKRQCCATSEAVSKAHRQPYTPMQVASQLPDGVPLGIVTLNCSRALNWRVRLSCLGAGGRHGAAHIATAGVRSGTESGQQGGAWTCDASSSCITDIPAIICPADRPLLDGRL